MIDSVRVVVWVDVLVDVGIGDLEVEPYCVVQVGAVVARTFIEARRISVGTEMVENILIADSSEQNFEDLSPRNTGRESDNLSHLYRYS